MTFNIEQLNLLDRTELANLKNHIDRLLSLYPNRSQEPIRVDVSGMKTWKDCQLKHFFSYFKKVQQAGNTSPNNPFVFGSIGHDALENWYAPHTYHLNDAASKAATNSWKRYWDHDFFKDERTADWALLLNDIHLCLDNYYKHYESEKMRPIASEMPFNVPILEGKIELYGKVDNVMEYRGEEKSEDLVYFLENKFYKTIPTDTQYLQWDFQVSVYFLIGRMLYGDKFGGILYNIIRKKEPVRAKDVPLYHREEIYRTDSQLKSILKFVAVQAMQMNSVYSKGPLYLVPALDGNPLWSNMCKRCEFNNDLCRAFREGGDWEAIIEAAYTPRDLSYAESDE